MAIVSEPMHPLDAFDEPELLCTAETAECTCPEFCERDHDID